MLEEMKAVGCRFNVITMNVFLDACSKVGDTARATKAVARFCRIPGATPPPSIPPPDKKKYPPYARHAMVSQCGCPSSRGWQTSIQVQVSSWRIACRAEAVSPGSRCQKRI